MATDAKSTDSDTLLISFAETTDEIYAQERRSAILRSDTPLYKLARDIRAVLEKQYGDALQPLRMDYHIALMSYTEMKSAEYATLLAERYALISETRITPTFGFISKAFVLWTTAKSHITLGWFPGGHPSADELAALLTAWPYKFVECEDPLGE